MKRVKKKQTRKMKPIWSDNTLVENDAKTEEMVEAYWNKTLEDLEKSYNPTASTIPPNMVRRIMRRECQFGSMSSEVPFLLAKLVEAFMREITMRSWFYAKLKRNKNLLPADISLGVASSDKFDFLADVVPFQEITGLCERQMLFFHRKRVSRAVEHFKQLEHYREAESATGESEVADDKE